MTGGIGGRIAQWARFWAGPENRAALLLLLLGVAVAGAAIAAAQEIASSVARRETQAFDEASLEALRAAKARLGRARPLVDAAARDITALGSAAVLGLLTFATCGTLLFCGRRQDAFLAAAVAIGAGLLNATLKIYFDRPRPPLAEEVFSPSFPSGHALASMAIYLALGLLLARMAPAWRARIFVTALALLFAALVAFSRVYLEVHYPTDALAGALAGLAWAIAILVADEVYRRRPAPPRGEGEARAPAEPPGDAPAAGAAGSASAASAASQPCRNLVE